MDAGLGIFQILSYPQSYPQVPDAPYATGSQFTESGASCRAVPLVQFRGIALRHDPSDQSRPKAVIDHNGPPTNLRIYSELAFRGR